MKFLKTILLLAILLLFPQIVSAANNEIVVTDADTVWNPPFATASSDVTDSTDAPPQALSEAFVSHADSVWTPGLEEIAPPGDQPPNCAIELQKDGEEISEINVGEFFDIYVGDSTGNIERVRFLSDENQNGEVDPGFTWTDWYSWDESAEDWTGSWNHETKIKTWAFATPGIKKVWAELSDGTHIATCSANIPATEDTIPPTIFGGKPLGKLPPGVLETTLTVQTDENAVCEYDRMWVYYHGGGGGVISETSPFTETGGTIHTTLITGLEPAVSYEYPVRCWDRTGNASLGEYIISFETSPSFNFYPEEPGISESVEFDALLLGLPNVIYQWDFGDGTTITTEQPKVTHEYICMGLFDVNLTIIQDSKPTYKLSENIKVFDKALKNEIENFTSQAINLEQNIWSKGDLLLDALGYYAKNASGQFLESVAKLALFWANGVGSQYGNKSIVTPITKMVIEESDLHTAAEVTTEFILLKVIDENFLGALGAKLVDRNNHDHIGEFNAVDGEKIHNLKEQIYENPPPLTEKEASHFVDNLKSRSSGNVFLEHTYGQFVALPLSFMEVKSEDESNIVIIISKFVSDLFFDYAVALGGKLFPPIKGAGLAVELGIGADTLDTDQKMLALTLWGLDSSDLWMNDISQNVIGGLKDIKDRNLSTFSQQAKENLEVKMEGFREYYQELCPGTPPNSIMVSDVYVHINVNNPFEDDLTYVLGTSYLKTHTFFRAPWLLGLEGRDYDLNVFDLREKEISEGQANKFKISFMENLEGVDPEGPIYFNLYSVPTSPTSQDGIFGISTLAVDPSDFTEIKKGNDICGIKAGSKWIWAKITNSPGELRVYNDIGQVTGLVDGEVREEIPDSMYIPEEEMAFLLDYSSSYRYKLIGTDEGTYGLVITSAGEMEETTFIATDVPTTPGQNHQYTVDWDAFAQGERGVNVQIDFDGDGEFEESITSDRELTQEEFVSEAHLAKWLKERAKENLEDTKTGNEEIDQKIDKVLGYLEKSLENNLWVDESHLNPKNGRMVFQLEAQAVRRINLYLRLSEKLKNLPLPELVKNKFVLPETVKTAFEQTITDLVKADEILAEVAIEDARNDPVQDPKKQGTVDRLINRAEEKMDEGRSYIENRPGRAIEKFRLAWIHTQEALRW